MKIIKTSEGGEIITSPSELRELKEMSRLGETKVDELISEILKVVEYIKYPPVFIEKNTLSKKDIENFFKI